MHATSEEEKRNKMKQFFKDMLNSESSVSSKRFCGLLGWLLCLILCCYCTYKQQEAPDVVEILFICSTSLLGIDSITNIWKKNINANK